MGRAVLAMPTGLQWWQPPCSSGSCLIWHEEAEDMGQISRGKQPRDRCLESAAESRPTLQWVRPSSQSEPLPCRHMHLQDGENVDLTLKTRKTYIQNTLLAVFISSKYLTLY